MVIVGIWIEKGMGLIVPGFIPSTLHEVVEYAPSLTEWKVTAGIWALGFLILTAMLKVAVAVFTDQMKSPPKEPTDRTPSANP
jgi:molybdopterin-containing oxidoreductase family membrane subunit